MKIYAIRDRLIDYFLQPFVAPGDKQVLASLSQAITNGETTNALAQAPHHFEVWALGEVQEDGTLTAKREFLADCSSLVRTGVRQAAPDQSGEATRGTPTGRSQSPPERIRTDTGTDPGAPSGAPQESAQPAPETRPGSDGIPRIHGLGNN